MPLRLATTYLLRGAGLWLTVRLFAQAVARMARSPDGSGVDAGHLAPLLVTTAIAIVDLWRRRERLFLANLGIPTGVAVTLMLLPPALGELTLSLTTDAA